MSLSTLLGIIFGFSLIFGAIIHGTDNYWSFLSMEGFLIVIGGCLANAFMSYQARYVILALQALWTMLKKPVATREGMNADIMRLIKWAYVVQTKGLVGLEGEIIRSVKDPFMKYGLELVTTGYKPADVRSMMETAIESEFERRTVPVAVLKNMASCGPAFGMVGTLVGMVIMLGNLQTDMSKIGSGLAVALLATLYGVVSARLAFLPSAEKLLQKEEILRHRNHMMAEGLVLLSEKQSPRFMQDKLNSYLDPEIHFNIDTQLKR